MKTILCGARGVACSFVSSALSCRNSSTSCAYIFLYTRNLSDVCSTVRVSTVPCTQTRHDEGRGRPVSRSRVSLSRPARGAACPRPSPDCPCAPWPCAACRDPSLRLTPSLIRAHKATVGTRSIQNTIARLHGRVSTHGYLQHAKVKPPL